MVSVKLIAFDLDGTAIIAHKDFPSENREAIEKATEMGILIVPCTGRLLSFLPDSIASLRNLRYVITCNGAAVEDISENRIIYSAYIPPEKISEVLSAINKFDIYKEIYSSGQAYTAKGNPEKAEKYFHFPEDKLHFTTKKYVFVDSLEEYFSEHKLSAEKINLPYLPIEIREKVKDKLRKIDGLKLTSSIPDNLEINAAGATKGQALKALCEHLNIDRNFCMAIGDNGNDVDMLEYAGISYAIGNGSPEALTAAKYITDDCEKYGFGKAVMKEISK